MKKVRNMSADELRGEIERVRLALAATESAKLRDDYTKYMKKLERSLHCVQRTPELRKSTATYL